MSYLYCLYDKVAKRYSHFMVADSDGMYVREMVAHRVAFPMHFDDFTPLCLGDLDDHFDDVRDVDWSCWRYPDTEDDLLAPLGLSPDEKKEIVANRIKLAQKEGK